jgi:hypothetical protein
VFIESDVTISEVGSAVPLRSSESSSAVDCVKSSASDVVIGKGVELEGVTSERCGSVDGGVVSKIEALVSDGDESLWFSLVTSGSATVLESFSCVSPT